MADDLKRVGLKLTAEGAKDYKTALKECSAATKENYSELKLAQSQYDKNTSSMKKLQDRQKYLSNQSDIYKDKVKILNAQLKEMENAEKRDETAIAKKRAELNQAEAKLNSYEKSLADVNKQLSNHSAQLKEWGGKLQDVGGKMQSVGKTMTTHVTAPIVAGAAASVAAFNEVDGAMDVLVQKTGATGKALEDMEGIVESIATTIPTSFDTAANAVGEVNTRFGVTGKALDDLSTRFIKFADLNKVEVSDSIDNTQKALSAFGLGAESAGTLLDVLNRTGQNTGVSMDTLLSGLVQNSAALQEMGLSIDQSVVFMGQLEKSGANSETVMQGLRKALKNATKEGIPMNQALQNLHDTIKNGTGSMDGLTAAYDLFGKSGDQIYAAVKNGTIDFTQLANSQSILADSADSVGKSYEGTVDPIDQAKMAMNEAKLIGADIVTSAAPMIRDALAAIRDVIKDLRKWWGGLSEDEQQNILKMAGVAAAVGPVIAMLGSLVSTIGTIITVIGSLGAAAPVIATVAAFIVATIATINNFRLAFKALGLVWDWLKNNAGTIWESIKTTISNAVQSITTTITNKWNAVKTITMTIWNAIKTGISNTITAAKNTVTNIVNGIRTNIGNAWEWVRSNTVDKFNDIKNGISNALQSAKDVVGKMVNKIKSLLDFDWSLPKIKLPHFTITGSFSLNPPSTPHFDVDWYARAYQRAAYYDSPSIRSDGRGYGDRQGGEFAVGERHLRSVVREASGANLENKLDQLIDLLATYLPASANQQINVVLDSGVLVGQLIPKIDSGLGSLNKLKGRGL